MPLYKTQGPYAVNLDANYCDVDTFAIFARRQYQTLKLAQEALPGVRLKKTGEAYVIHFGGRKIGTLEKAKPTAPVITQPQRAGLRQVWQAVALTIAALIGRLT